MGAHGAPEKWACRGVSAGVGERLGVRYHRFRYFQSMPGATSSSILRALGPSGGARRGRDWGVWCVDSARMPKDRLC